MAVDQKQVQEELVRRHSHAEQVRAYFDGRQNSYSEWKARCSKVYDVAAGNLPFSWPDGMRSDGEMKIPNLITIAAEDRARAVAQAQETVVCPPAKTTIGAKVASELRERVLAGYWDMSRVREKKHRWAHDLMMTGLAAVKVLPDFSEPKNERFPIYQRVSPEFMYPSPIFAPGPFIDDVIIAYEEDARAVSERFDVDLTGMMGYARKTRANEKTVRVVEFYDDDYLCVYTSLIGGRKGQDSGWEWLIEPFEHGLEVCPVVIGVRPTPDDVYRGDFEGVLPIMNVGNKMMTMELDAAIDRTYPERVVYDIANPEEYGPDATLEAQSPNARVEYVTKPSSGFQNVQMMNVLTGFARVGALFPLARSGDPNESVISAAGITAADSQRAEHVLSLLRDCISPMLSAANEVALRADEMWCDTTKEITGMREGAAFSETYRPSVAIAGNYRSRVVYGGMSGIGPVNENVLTLQQLGNGVISRLTAMEKSPLVENPLVESKRIAKEQLENAMFAGLVAKAAMNEIDPTQVAAIWKDLEKEKGTLADAIEKNLIVTAPLATPPGMEGQPAMGGAPGLPGAARGQQPEPFAGPPLNELVAGRR